jgi:hypothetical protein
VKGCKDKDLTALDLMISGGFGGFFCWFFSYPQDVIKTKLQLDKISEFGKFEISKGVYLPDGGII